MSSVDPQTPYNEYPNVDGVTTVFPYEFQLLSAADLVVTVDGAVIPSSDFILTGVGVQAGGDVTFNTAPLAGRTVLLSRVLALQRTTDYQYNGDLKENTVDNDFNRLWQALQGFNAIIGGAVRAPFPEQIPALPDKVTRANTLQGYDANGDPIVTTPDSGSAAGVALALAQFIANLASPASGKGDALVAVLESATGAVARTQHSKNDDVVSIRTFGAVLDGVADDSPAFVKAVAYGGRVSFPPGTARLASKISIPTSSTVFFVGDAGIPLNKSRILVDLNGPAFEMAGGTTSFVGFENIFFTANAARTSTQAFKGIGDGVHCHFERCTFDNFKGFSVEMATAFASLFKNCLFQFNFATSLKVSAGSALKLQQCTFEANYAGGADLFGSGFVLDTCYFENNCKDNNPATLNANNRELKLGGAQHTVIGGNLTLWPTNNKFPIELAAARATTFIGVRGFNLGAAPHWVNINATDSSVLALDCPDFTYAGVTQNLIVQDAGYTTTKPDITMNGVSVRQTTSRGWVVFDGTGGVGPAAIRQAVSIPSVAKTATGSYTVTIPAGLFANSSYSVNIGVACAAAVACSRYVFSTKATTTLEIRVNNTSTTALVDADEVCVELTGV